MQPKLLLSTVVALSLLSAATLEDELAGFDDAVEVPSAQSSEKSDALMEGFDDIAVEQAVETSQTEQANTLNTAPPQVTDPYINGVTGKVTLEYAYSPSNTAPHDTSSSLKGTLSLDYEHKFSNGYRVKVNGRGYYDAMYQIKGRDKFSQPELDALESEVELFDAYIQGSLRDNLDFKIGRQVVVWGRSDTVRITDVLNPLDSRRPGMVDIEDLRLPVTMAKFDYFLGSWRITPIAVLEQRFSKTAPAGSAFNPSEISDKNEVYSDVTYALSIGGEFSGWDVNFYASKLRDDTGYLNHASKYEHDKVTMFGAALNYISGEWLFKTEIAHFDGLYYTTQPDDAKRRLDVLVGFEYEGFQDTSIFYDFSLRKVDGYSPVMLQERIPVYEKQYQHAFRVSKDFMNDRVSTNYLISLYGKSLDKGGYQRLWVEYDIADAWSATVGVVDYIGGTPLFDIMEDNDMLFTSISYSF